MSPRETVLDVGAEGGGFGRGDPVGDDGGAAGFDEFDGAGWERGVVGGGGGGGGEGDGVAPSGFGA